MKIYKKGRLRALIVKDSDPYTALLVEKLKNAGYDLTFRRVDTAKTMKHSLKKQKWDVIITDYVMPHFDGHDALKVLEETGLHIPLIVISGTVGEDILVSAMKTELHGSLMRDHITRLLPAIELELREARINKKNRRSKRRSLDQEIEAPLEEKRHSLELDKQIEAPLREEVRLREEEVLLEKFQSQMKDNPQVILSIQNVETSLASQQGIIVEQVFVPQQENQVPA